MKVFNFHYASGKCKLNDTEIFNRMAKLKKTEIIKCW